MFLTRLLLALLKVYSWLILARVILSWVNPQPRHTFLVMVIRVTEPVLRLLRPLVPIPGLDLSPILAFLLIQLASRLLAGG
ncbi:MAG: YggT family protein [Candidatus Krumholzibacteriia bacterium]